MNEPIIVLVGFTLAAISSLQTMHERYRVLIIEEPDVIRKRNITALIEGKDIVYDLLPYEYQHLYAADALYASLKELNIVSVVPAVEYATCCAARLAERFNVPGATYGASLLMRDKSKLRNVSKAFGINNPKSEAITTYQQAEEFFMSSQGAIILKPSNRQGSVGTVIVHDKDKLFDSWALAQVKDEGAMVPDREFISETLIEEFITGNEYSVEALVKDNEIIFSNVTQKLLFDGVRPVEKGHIVPALLELKYQNELVELTQKLVSAVDFRYGVVHCEWIHNEKGFYLVECAGRFPGDGIVELIERAYCYDVVRNYHCLMRGQQIETPPNENQHHAMIHFYGGEEGTIKKIKINDDLINELGVFNFSLSIKDGDQTFYPESSWHRNGSAMLIANSQQELKDKIALLGNTVVITYEDR
ncbi:Alanine-anticapsin ligase BacD [Serratia entomophila]|uniref:ATP-grasp domain-containing protein n=1 Tax=Serratia entomophila TaxID=42906 RepID=UPI00217A2D49|nr:ATP-grasp domain-containing protein [Serratia entomophila]CAI1907678.1 Alanine-anticapsin ligase BacD [Serratia entomophila]